jgi:hypothetical protein
VGGEKIITAAIMYDQSSHSSHRRKPVSSLFWFPAFAGTTPGCRIESGMTTVYKRIAVVTNMKLRMIIYIICLVLLTAAGIAGVEKKWINYALG